MIYHSLFAAILDKDRIKIMEKKKWISFILSKNMNHCKIPAEYSSVC